MTAVPPMQTVPCNFDEKGFAPCKDPSTNGMLTLRGIPTDIEVADNLWELLKNQAMGFRLTVCYSLRIKDAAMEEFPAIRKNTQIPLITQDRLSLVEAWKRLDPKFSEVVGDSWMVNKDTGVGYRMTLNEDEQRESRPYKVFSKDEINDLLASEVEPFAWATGLIGFDVSPAQFEELIQEEVTA